MAGSGDAKILGHSNIDVIELRKTGTEQHHEEKRRGSGNSLSPHQGRFDSTMAWEICGTMVTIHNKGVLVGGLIGGAVLTISDVLLYGSVLKAPMEAAWRAAGRPTMTDLQRTGSWPHCFARHSCFKG